MNEQWVQSIYSKDAKKWKLAQIEPGDSSEYIVYGEGCVSEYFVYGDDAQLQYLPKSEYAPCEPPERWVSMMEKLTKSDVEGNWRVPGDTDDCIGVSPGYRLRKAEADLVGPGVPHGCEKTWVLVLEKKVQP